MQDFREQLNLKPRQTVRQLNSKRMQQIGPQTEQFELKPKIAVMAGLKQEMALAS